MHVKHRYKHNLWVHLARENYIKQKLHNNKGKKTNPDKTIIRYLSSQFIKNMSIEYVLY